MLALARFNVVGVWFLFYPLIASLPLVLITSDVRDDGPIMLAVWSLSQVVGDLMLRVKHNYPFQIRNLFLPTRGGNIQYIPSWCIGITSTIFATIGQGVEFVAWAWLAGIPVGYLGYFIAGRFAETIVSLPCTYCQQPLIIPPEPRPVEVACPRCQARFVIRE